MIFGKNLNLDIYEGRHINDVWLEIGEGVVGNRGKGMGSNGDRGGGDN